MSGVASQIEEKIFLHVELFDVPIALIGIPLHAEAGEYIH